MEVRWGDVHAGTAPQRDASCAPTASPMKPPQRVACYRPRWSIETTCQAGREAWKREATNGDGPPTVRRFTPCVGGLYTSMVRRDLQRPSSFTTRRAVSWPGQSPGPLSARRLGRRRALGHQGCFHPQAQARAFSQLSPSCRATLRYALAPAAYRAGHVMSHGGMFLQGAAYPTGQSRAQRVALVWRLLIGQRCTTWIQRVCMAIHRDENSWKSDQFCSPNGLEPPDGLGLPVGDRCHHGSSHEASAGPRGQCSLGGSLSSYSGHRGDLCFWGRSLFLWQ